MRRRILPIGSPAAVAAVVRSTTIVAGLVLLTTSPAAAASGGWSPLPPGVGGKVETLLSVDGKLYVGGDFDDAGGIGAADRIAVWSGNTWSAVGPGLGASANAVFAIAVDGTDVYAGGSFTDAGGDPFADGIARWNGATWQAITTVQLAGPVYALATVGRTLYVGGGFLNANGLPLADYIAKYDLDTGAWSAMTDGGANDIGSPVRAIIPDGAGSVYVGGSFTDVDGDATADFVVHYDGGTSWSALGSDGSGQGGINAPVRALARSGTTLYVGGSFTHAGSDANADRIARWNSGAWSALGASSAFASGTIYGIAVAGSIVFVDGVFTNAAGNPLADGIAAFDGGTWRNVGSNPTTGDGPATGQMTSAAMVGGKLFVGGLDTSIGGSAANANVALYRVWQPDAIIKAAAKTRGSNVYGGPSSQTIGRTIDRGSSGTFSIIIQNDGFSSDSFTVKGAPKTQNGLTAHYLDGATDITTRVNAGTYTINNLAPAAARTITLRVTVAGSAAAGITRTFTITATSAGTPIAKDKVGARVTVG